MLYKCIIIIIICAVTYSKPREHVSLREHACVSSRGAQSTELVWILDFKQILLLLFRPTACKKNMSWWIRHNSDNLENPKIFNHKEIYLLE